MWSVDSSEILWTCASYWNPPVDTDVRITTVLGKTASKNGEHLLQGEAHWTAYKTASE